MNYPSPIPENAPMTVREKNISFLIDLISNMKNEVAGYENEPLFKTIVRGDPDDDLPEINPNSVPAIGIEDGEETRESDWHCGVVTKILMVFIHVRFNKGQQGVEPYKVFNYYLGRLQHAILQDNNNKRLGGNCMDVNEVASAPQIFSQDNLLGGFLQLRIQYRHMRDDPYTQK